MRPRYSSFYKPVDSLFEFCPPTILQSKRTLYNYVLNHTQRDGGCVCATPNIWKRKVSSQSLLKEIHKQSMLLNYENRFMSNILKNSHMYVYVSNMA